MIWKNQNWISIGSNIGLFALICADLVGPQGEVYTFEPDSVLYDSMVCNIQRNKIANIQPYNLALRAKTDHVVLHRSVFNSGDNRISAAGALNLLEACQVRMIRFDSVLADTRIDFIKMDVQGWEINVVKGMHQILAKNPSIVVYFEFWPSGLALAGYDPIELLNLLKKSGLKIFKTDGGSEKEMHDFDKLTASIKCDRTINFIAKTL